MLRRAASLLPPLRRPLPPALGAASCSLRTGPSGQRRRPLPLAPQLGAAATTTADQNEEEDQEGQAAGPGKAVATRRARWEAVQRRAFEREGGEDLEGEEEEEEEEEEGEEEEWEVDLRGEARGPGLEQQQQQRRRRVRNAPDVLLQGQGDEGVGFSFFPSSSSSFTSTDTAHTAHSPTLQRAMRELLADPGAVHAEEERWRRRLGLGPTSRESVFEAMRRRLQAEERGASPSKRQLRLAAAVQGALSDCFYRDGLCPATRRGDGSPMVDITEVNMSADLRHAVVRWTPATSVDVDARNGVGGGTEAWATAARLRGQLIRGLQAQLDKGTRRLRFECARRLKLKRVPALEFRPDEMVEAARAVDPLLGSLTLSSSSISEEEEGEGKGEQREGRERR